MSQKVMLQEQMMQQNKYKELFSIYILSPDFIISVVIGIILFFVLPVQVKMLSTETVYNLGITILSIIFSVFFAVLALVISTTDNDFIVFLEEEKVYTTLIRSFKIVLIVLFISLIYSIVLYIANDFYIREHGSKSWQHKSLVVIFQVMATYSLFSTAMCIYDALKFSSLRVRYISLQESKRKFKEKKQLVNSD